MDRKHRNLLLRALTLSLATVTACAAYASDGAGPSRRHVTWAEVARWPDFTGGQWAIKGSLVNTLFFRDAPLRPEFKSQARSLPDPSADGCLPRGLPSMIGGEFFYAGDSILLVNDFSHLIFRRIFMDGRSHQDADPTYFGHSLGHWEGRTLVVDTAALLPEVEVAGVSGHGEATHIVERYEPVDAMTLKMKITITNAEVLTAPLIVEKTLVRLPDLEVREAFCQQNDRNAPIDGRAHNDLTPPK